jgi:hypothetical protein
MARHEIANQPLLAFTSAHGFSIALLGILSGSNSNFLIPSPRLPYFYFLQVHHDDFRATLAGTYLHYSTGTNFWQNDLSRFVTHKIKSTQLASSKFYFFFLLLHVGGAPFPLLSSAGEGLETARLPQNLHYNVFFSTLLFPSRMVSYLLHRVEEQHVSNGQVTHAYDGHWMEGMIRITICI